MKENCQETGQSAKETRYDRIASHPGQEAMLLVPSGNWKTFRVHLLISVHSSLKVEMCYSPIIQSGGKFTLKFSTVR